MGYKVTIPLKLPMLWTKIHVYVFVESLFVDLRPHSLALSEGFDLCLSCILYFVNFLLHFLFIIYKEDLCAKKISNCNRDVL